MRKIYAILKKVFQPMGRILSTREWAIKKETKLLLNKFKNNFEKAFEESLNGATDIVPIHDLIAANTEATKEKIKSLFPKLTILNAQLEGLQEELNKDASEMREEEKKKLAPFIYEQMSKAVKKIIPAQERLALVTNKINLLRSQVRVSNGPLKKMIVDTALGVFTATALTFGLEVFFSTSTFEAMGFIQIEAGFIAASISLMLGYVSLMTARSYHDMDMRRAMAWCGIGGFLVMILVIARVIEGLNILPSLFLMALFAINIMLMLAYLKRKEHFDKVSVLSKSEHEKASLQSLIFSEKDKIVELTLKGHAQIEHIVQNRIRQTKIEHTSCFLAREAEQNRLDDALNFVDALSEEALKQANQLLAEAANSRTEAGNEDHMSGARGFWKKTAMLILMSILIGGITSCNTSKEEDRVTIFLNTDETGSISGGQTTAQSVYQYVHDEILNLDDEPLISSRVDVHLTHISDSWMPSIVTITLDQGTLRLFTNGPQREKEIKAFKKELRNAIEQNFQVPPSKPRTVIYRNVLNQFDMLREVSGRKYMILITDFIQEGEVSFKPFESNPARLREQASTVRELLEQKSKPLGRLDGIEIYMVYTTQGASDEFLYHSRMFFYDWFQDVGGTPILRPNL